MTPIQALQRRRASRARSPSPRHPNQLHVFEFCFGEGGLHRRFATVLVRGRMGQIAAIGLAYADAVARGRQPFCTSIRSVPAPRTTPKLDAICRRHTAFLSFLSLLTATAGYRPSIRLDRTGRDGVVLARAYDRVQAAWRDPRRACVSGDLPRRQRRTAP